MARAVKRAAGALFAVCGLGLLSFGVAAWAGAVALVVTTGSSMDPTYASGDLVLVRSVDRYEVGDVVAYHNHDLGQVVLHRIVAVEDGALVTKGDDNSWVDSYRPRPSEVQGRQWLHVPGFGRHLQVLFDPKVIAAVVGSATLVVLGGRSPDPVSEPGAGTCAGAGC